MRRRSTLLALTLAGAFGLSTALPAQAADQRLFGPDRYATASAVSQAFEGSLYSPVYLATGENFPDALAASAAAGADQSRVLLTGRYALPQATIDELARLDTFAVYLVGGTGSVSTAVEAQLGRLGYLVLRLSGQDRYDTAVTAAQVLWEDPDTVFLATGENYPDALAGAAAAGNQGAPILLVGRDRLPAPVAEALAPGDPLGLSPSRFFVLGGEGAVSDAVLDEIRALGHQGATFERLGGATRYDTAVAVGRRFFDGSTAAVLAVGDNYPDALAAGPFAAQIDAPLLLTGATSTPAETRAELDRRQPADRWFVGAARPS
ncbi:cell wall-binding repeat-containing protein [Kineococcus sp. SYSU DK004]|uniref:cell wall-binding repeat-containing protein n=1 Tax=Kineococcus sp. SYSU DK004 TaxID=3383125 RepID=UPI003D7EFBFE